MSFARQARPPPLLPYAGEGGGGGLTRPDIPPSIVGLSAPVPDFAAYYPYRIWDMRDGMTLSTSCRP